MALVQSPIRTFLGFRRIIGLSKGLYRVCLGFQQGFLLAELQLVVECFDILTLTQPTACPILLVGAAACVSASVRQNQSARAFAFSMLQGQKSVLARARLMGVLRNLCCGWKQGKLDASDRQTLQEYHLFSCGIRRGKLRKGNLLDHKFLQTMLVVAVWHKKMQGITKKQRLWHGGHMGLCHGADAGSIPGKCMRWASRRFCHKSFQSFYLVDGSPFEI